MKPPTLFSCPITSLLLTLRQRRCLGYVLLLSACTLFSYPAAAQALGLGLDGENIGPRYLVLDKPGLNKRIRFYPGQRIRFKLKGESYKYNAVLQAVGEKSIVIYDAPIFLDEIHTIYYTKPIYILPVASAAFTGGGILFAGLGVINEISRNNPDLVVAGAGLVLLGQALKPLYKRKYRIRGNRRLRTL